MNEVVKFLRLLIDGIFNHLEGPYLDAKFHILKFFGVYVYKSEMIGQDVFDGVWVEIMPSRQLIKYTSYRGDIIWRYIQFDGIAYGSTQGGQPMILEFRGRRGTGIDMKPTSMEVIAEINKANEQAFYNDLDKTLGT